VAWRTNWTLPKIRRGRTVKEEPLRVRRYLRVDGDTELVHFEHESAVRKGALSCGGGIGCLELD
jgi:hypothetical protein